MTDQEEEIVKRFLDWFNEEGYYVLCQYDKYTAVYKSRTDLFEQYREYREEVK